MRAPLFSAIAAVMLVVTARPASADEPPGAGPPTDDGALLSTLLSMFDPWATPEQRLAALRSPAVRDRRAIPALVFLMSDRDARIRAGAASALGGFRQAPRAEAALIDRARAVTEAVEVRMAAVRALAEMGGPTAGEALYAIYVDDAAPLEVRRAAQRALETRFPALLAAQGTAEVVDRAGRPLLILGSALLGSYALAAVGGLGENDTGVTIGALGGIVTGAGIAYFLTRSEEVTRAQAGWILTAGGWGAGLGMLTAGAVDPDPSSRLVLSLGLLGEGLGLGAAVLSRRSTGFEAGDVAFINGGGLLGFDLALGASFLFDEPDDRAVLGGLAGGAAAGLVTAGLLARQTHFSLGDRALVAEGGYEGFMFGVLLPTAYGSDNGRRTTAGALLGLGAGVALGAGASQALDVELATVSLGWLIGSYGKLLGLSIPLLAEGDSADLALGTITGSALSLAGAAVVAPRLELEGGDRALVALGTGLGFWHGLGFGASSTRLSDDQAFGLTLLGASAGGLATLAGSQVLDLSNSEVLAIGGGAFWGTWFTVWTGVLIDDDDDFDLRPAVAIGDLGLAAGASLIQRVDSRRIGIANLSGLSGAALASLGAALVSSDNDHVIAANLIGSGVVLGAGAALAAAIDLAPARSPGPGPATATAFGISPFVPALATDTRAVGLSLTLSPGL